MLTETSRRRIHALVVVVIVIVLAALIRPWSSSREPLPPKRKGDAAAQAPASGPSFAAYVPEFQTIHLPRRPGDLQQCRKVLSRHLAGLRMSSFGDPRILHRGTSAPFKSLAREFAEAAGEDLVPIVKELLGECRSSAAKYFLAALLAYAPPDAGQTASEALRRLVEEGSSPEVVGSALYSMAALDPAGNAQFLISYARLLGDKGLWHAERLALPALGLCGKDGLAELVKRSRAFAAETAATPYFGLALMRPETVFDDLRAIVESESEPLQVRALALASVAQSGEAAHLEYLAGLYEGSSDPLLRKAILRACITARASFPLDWQMKAECWSSVADRVVAATSATPDDPEAQMMLLSLSGFASDSSRPAAATYREWLEAGTSGFRGNSQLLNTVLAASLIGSSADRETVRKFLENPAIGKQQALDLLARGTSTNPAFRLLDPVLIEELLNALPASAGIKDARLHRIQALVNSTVSEHDLSEALAQVFRESSPLDRLNLLEDLDRSLTCAYTGGPLTPGVRPRPFLEGVIEQSADLLPRIFAARACFSGGTGPEGLDPRLVNKLGIMIKEVASFPDAINLIHGRVGAIGAYGQLVGDYYSRFGVASDILFLEGLPDLLCSFRRAGAPSEDALRQQVSAICTQAADAIRLRAR